MWPAVRAARAIGLGDERGRLMRGAVADVVLLSPELQVRTTIVGGEIAYSADGVNATRPAAGLL